MNVSELINTTAEDNNISQVEAATKLGYILARKIQDPNVIVVVSKKEWKEIEDLQRGIFFTPMHGTGFALELLNVVPPTYDQIHIPRGSIVLEPLNPPTLQEAATSKDCSCDIIDLWNNGCSCGAKV